MEGNGVEGMKIAYFGGVDTSARYYVPRHARIAFGGRGCTGSEVVTRGCVLVTAGSCCREVLYLAHILITNTTVVSMLVPECSIRLITLHCFQLNTLPI